MVIIPPGAMAPVKLAALTTEAVSKVTSCWTTASRPAGRVSPKADAPRPARSKRLPMLPKSVTAS